MSRRFWAIMGSSPIPDGAVLWLKADEGPHANDDGTGAPVNGGKIASWRDKSINGHLLVETVSGEGPLYRTGAINGLPAVEFDSGTTTYLAKSGVTNLIDSALAFTLFIVADGPNAGGAANTGRIIAQDEGSGATDKWIFHNSGTAGASSTAFHLNGSAGSTNFGLDGTAVIGSVPTYLTFRRQPSTGVWDTWIDGGPDIVAGGPFTTEFSRPNTGPIELGKAEGASPFDGQVAEIIIYQRALSDTEVDAVHTYLANKWGI